MRGGVLRSSRFLGFTVDVLQVWINMSSKRAITTDKSRWRPLLHNFIFLRRPSWERCNKLEIIGRVARVQCFWKPSRRCWHGHARKLQKRRPACGRFLCSTAQHSAAHRRAIAFRCRGLWLARHRRTACRLVWLFQGMLFIAVYSTGEGQVHAGSQSHPEGCKLVAVPLESGVATV